MNSSRPLRVAVIGSGPAGIYASDLLMKSGRTVEIDLFEQMPAPFGLIRYGVAPDHPRIKGIVNSLHAVMEKILPLQKQFTIHRTFILHAAWLDQSSDHCPIFLTAASCKNLVRISVPVWGTSLSEPLSIVALGSRYLSN